jgi:hypothetical protein
MKTFFEFLFWIGLILLPVAICFSDIYLLAVCELFIIPSFFYLIFKRA